MPSRLVRLCCLWLALGVPALTFAQAPAPPSDEAEQKERTESASRTYVNARVGAASSNRNGRPEVCVEGAPLAVLSVEACGTGAQVWHDDPNPEMMHMRVKGRVLSLGFQRFYLQGFVGAGFAELSVGSDDAGFAFNRASEGRASTAGAELTLSSRALVPLSSGFELLADLSLAAAYLPHADELVIRKSQFQPTLAFSLGLGF